jgi:ethanolamine ammonia-lyase large subunit
MVVDFLTMYAWIFCGGCSWLLRPSHRFPNPDARAGGCISGLVLGLFGAVLGADPVVARVLALLLLFARCVRRLKLVGRGSSTGPCL